MSLITQQNQLLEICDLIHQHKITAIDTEFIRENTYLPILCLIQINVAGNCYAVDPLSELDLSPFLEIINNPKIIKIFHSARQDLEILLLNFPNQVSPKLIFDTQIMAALCGLGHTVSYSNLAKDLLDKEVCKDWQRSDWQKRPLHKDQIEYAKTDVLYLPEIYQILQDKLTKAKKTIWAQEEMDLNIQKALSEDDLCKKFSLTNKPQSYQENINILVNWRDQTAKQYNVPRSFVVRDEVLEKISTTNPGDLETLEQFNIRTRVSNSDFKQKFLTEILDLLTNKPITEKPITKKTKIIFRLTEPQKELYQKARILLQTQSQSHQISPELIVNQVNLQHLISGNKLINEILAGWRFEVFGVELERFIREESVEDLFVNHKA
jgi:ribonuclease D